MSLLELPVTRGCAVCGPHNAHGLKLRLSVDRQSGVVRTEFTPGAEHIGFEGIVHGGILATVLDEAMVWAASWHAKRFCVCGEMNVRYRQIARIGQVYAIEARIDAARSRLIETVGEIRAAGGAIVAEATGKYVPVTAKQSEEFMRAVVDEPRTAPAARMLRGSRRPETNETNP